MNDALLDIGRAMQIIRACRMVEPEFVPDWTDKTQKKYLPLHNEVGGWDVCHVIYDSSAPAYVSSEESARKVIKILEAMK